MKTIHFSLIFISFALIPCQNLQAATYIFAGEANGVDVVTHPHGYSGTGGILTVTVGIDPTSSNAAAMVIPTQNVIATWNGLVPTLHNVQFGVIAGGQMDFESVLLHEMGHSIGLGHVNLASEAMLADSDDENYSNTTNGVDNTFNLGIGGDGVRGSSDDIRGDDVNLNYFRIGVNNPFTLDAIVDSTTYTRDITGGNLPMGHTFVANADRDVADLLGIDDGNPLTETESVMQQGSFFGEIQRTLGHDDVIGIRYAMAGLDEIQGTADDYILNLVFAGLTTSADIVIDFDNTRTGFAVSSSSGIFLNDDEDHLAITTNQIFFNTGFNWHFNDTPIPEPSTYILLGMIGIGLAGYWKSQSEKKVCE